MEQSFQGQYFICGFPLNTHLICVSLLQDLNQLLEERADEHRKHKQMELLVEQLQQETSRSSRENGELRKLLVEYKHASDQRAAEAEKAVQTLRQDHIKLTSSAHERGRSHFDKSSATLAESERVMGETRHLLNIYKNNLQRRPKDTRT